MKWACQFQTISPINQPHRWIDQSINSNLSANQTSSHSFHDYNDIKSDNQSLSVEEANQINRATQSNQSNQLHQTISVSVIDVSKCIGLMKSVESNAFVILWCLCTILCIKNQHAEVTCQNPLGFLTSGAGPQTSKNDKISASKFLGAAILTKQGPGPVFLSP